MLWFRFLRGLLGAKYVIRRSRGEWEANGKPAVSVGVLITMAGGAGVAGVASTEQEAEDAS